MGTQWREGGMDYTALPVTARLLGIGLRRRRFAELRLMEAVVLRVLGERSKRAERKS